MPDKVWYTLGSSNVCFCLQSGLKETFRNLDTVSLPLESGFKKNETSRFYTAPITRGVEGLLK